MRTCFSLLIISTLLAAPVSQLLAEDVASVQVVQKDERASTDETEDDVEEKEKKKKSCKTALIVTGSVLVVSALVVGGLIWFAKELGKGLGGSIAHH